MDGDNLSELGKIESMPLREIWQNEASDFTVWLAEEENLNLLGEALGFDLSLLRTEAEVGKFRLDILAEESDTGEKVIIENQLESTNHDHLGKIITYASGYDAKAVVWIVKSAREEHQQAIDWLNSNTNENVGFFLVRIELWQIGDSLPAPKFEIISKPNTWTKTVRGADNAELTDTKLKQLEFWQGFKEYAESNNTSLRLRSPRAQHSYEMTIGSSKCRVALTINLQKKQFGCELRIKEDKDLYDSLFEKKSEVEAMIGDELKWAESPEQKRSKIKLSYLGDFDAEEQWDGAFEWLKNTAEKFQATFAPLVRNS